MIILILKMLIKINNQLGLMFIIKNKMNLKRKKNHVVEIYFLIIH